MSTTLAPKTEDLPKLLDTLEVSGLTNIDSYTAVSQIRYVLEEMGLVPQRAERPSEQAMRLSFAKRQARNPVPPVESLEEAVAQAKDVRFRNWASQCFWGLMRAFAEDYDAKVDIVIEKVKKEFKGNEAKLVQHINAAIENWNPVQK